jgi:hypothetical protein
VRDCDDRGSPTYFCNYACLSAHIEGNDLPADDACAWSPKKLCDARVGLIDELEDGDLIGAERASELHSEIYQPITTPNGQSEMTANSSVE